ncbi:branched-chain amino acid ABC transporter permease [Photobacterium gaetbulicola]|uniref:Branched-chain amino acid ABC transporter permease n=1 Tax=Photobacterium gaetbulicola TaxID=1295392 RepID=A0A0B9GHZ6_9GAMM|nr:ABC transporter permease [Photobacterium gaetbulicola]KHT64405.1 branched-chain amino acid ABC transporter permease [Photobacterium gaetbulicola]
MMKELMKNREALLAIVILVMIAAIGMIVPDFVQIGNLVSVYNDTSILIILALGQMFVIITRCIDLSIAANVALTGMVGAMINAAYPQVPVVFIIVICAGLGTLLGMLNGFLVWKAKIPAIVVSLGTMSIYRGCVFLLSDGQWINAHQMSESYIAIPRTEILGLPVLGWCSVVAIAGCYYFARHRRMGRNIYAAGNSPTAAHYVGINVGKKQFVSFSIAGFMAGIASYLWISRYAVAYVDIANGFELQVVAACVIGGVSIAGGTGTVLGCVLGAVFLGVINNALPVIGVSPFWQMAISGAVIIIAVVANSRSERKLGRIILKKAVQNAS